MVPAQKINDQTKLLAIKELAEIQNGWKCQVPLLLCSILQGLTNQALSWQLKREQRFAELKTRFGGSDDRG